MTITDVANRLAVLERRCQSVQEAVARLEHRFVELDALKQAVGELRFEIEDMREV